VSKGFVSKIQDGYYTALLEKYCLKIIVKMYLLAFEMIQLSILCHIEALSSLQFFQDLQHQP